MDVPDPLDAEFKVIHESLLARVHAHPWAIWIWN
jgi:hypothetical protein